MTIIGRTQKEAAAPPHASPFDSTNMPTDAQLEAMIGSARKAYKKALDKALAKVMAENPDCPRDIAESAANGVEDVKIAKAILDRNESEKRRREALGQKDGKPPVDARKFVG